MIGSSASFLGVLIVIVVGLIPTFIAIKSDHPHKVPIIIVNVLGGFLFGIGWLVALVWCFVRPQEKQVLPSSIAGEVEKLYALKEKGVISESEFNTKKSELMKS